MSRVKVGSKVKVSHPITCMNPEEYFTVHEIEFSTYPKKCWIRGTETCWFNTDMIVDVKDEDYV